MCGRALCSFIDARNAGLSDRVAGRPERTYAEICSQQPGGSRGRKIAPALSDHWELSTSNGTEVTSDQSRGIRSAQVTHLRTRGRAPACMRAGRWECVCERTILLLDLTSPRWTAEELLDNCRPGMSVSATAHDAPSSEPAGRNSLHTWPADIVTIMAHSSSEKKKMRHSVFRTVDTCGRRRSST